MDGTRELARAVATLGLVALLTTWTGSGGAAEQEGAASAGPSLAVVHPAPVPVSRRLKLSSAADLERELTRLNYPWPPRSEVPRVEVDALPQDLHALPVPRKKALFFRSLLPLVLAENQRLREQRAYLVDALARWPELGAEARDRLRRISAHYRVSGDLSETGVQAALLRRTDELPPALVLAQAANESGWGTSRFALEGNNLFGMWTYDPHRGLAPGGREAQARYWVRTYQRLHESVRHYMLTLNRHAAYRELRRLRERQRNAGRPLDAAELAAGLLRYSDRGADYVDEIQRMIRGNRLQQLRALELRTG